MHDVAIIGSGPAGVSAALTLHALNQKFIWLTSRVVSKKVQRAELVNNYPGLPAISGEGLANAFSDHYKSLGISVTEEVVTGVYKTDEGFTLLAKDREYQAKTVIMCLGVQSAKQLEGEEQFLGRGVSYCATCDGFLYKGKTLAVLCNDKKYEHEIAFLANIAEKLYVFPMYNNAEIGFANAEVILKNPVKLTGGMRLEKVGFKDGEISVDGMFIFRDFVSPSALVHGLETEGGSIKVNRDCSTNIKGLFAAGDCTGRPYQYVKAAGEGNVAAHSAAEYLSKR